ncbi:MAG: aspartate-ammonia lyase [Bacteroidia bacterium]
MKLKVSHKMSKHMVGLAGEFYVCAELCRRNAMALPTAKNNPLFDIIATTPDGKTTAAIQVKTMSLDNNQGWRLGKDMCSKKGNNSLFVVLVNLNEKSADCYIYPYDDLSEMVNNVYDNYIKQLKRNGDKRKDVDFRWIDLKHLDEKHKDNWGILKLWENRVLY